MEIALSASHRSVRPDADENPLRVAVLVPCFNEAITIGTVVRDFRTALPAAEIYVFDNNSTDQTAAIAAAAGAVVRNERHQGKGHVLRRMFAEIDADIYVLVDGDATYHAPSAEAMIERLRGERLDMVVGCRVPHEATAYRPGHAFGNGLLTGTVSFLFGDRAGDMLSGYRVLSRRFVKSFPALSGGFETETELTVHALSLRLPFAEMPTPYFARPEGSTSKLGTWRDGFRILWTILLLLKEERPAFFFSVIAAVIATAALVLSIPIIGEYLRTGLVPRFPTAILIASLFVLSAVAMTSGLILSSITRARRELRRLAYLAVR